MSQEKTMGQGGPIRGKSELHLSMAFLLIGHSQCQYYSILQQTSSRRFVRSRSVKYGSGSPARCFSSLAPPPKRALRLSSVSSGGTEDEKLGASAVVEASSGKSRHACSKRLVAAAYQQAHYVEALLRVRAPPRCECTAKLTSSYFICYLRTSWILFLKIRNSESHPKVLICLK